MHSDGETGAVPNPDPVEQTDGAEPAGTKGRSRGRNLVEWVLVVAGALAIAVVIQLTTLQAFRIPSESMLPLLRKGDRVLVNKWSYRLHDVHRGDVVVFTRPPALTDPTIDDLIKRVVGLPGDSVTIADGHVLINGEVLDEPYVAPGSTTLATGPVTCPPSDPCVIPDGKVWVMGDNRNQSEDSRWFGPIDESSIVGRAFVRLWPLSRLGGL
jgi:signal peptidase I